MYGVPKGIRTPVTAVKGRCPRPLDDGDAKNFYVVLLNGGAKRDRTADLYTASVALSQLSYSPETCAHCRDRAADRQALFLVIFYQLSYWR